MLDIRLAYVILEKEYTVPDGYFVLGCNAVKGYFD